MVEPQTTPQEVAEGQAASRASLNYNPDVLSCLANLSNDEVFTPPELVNHMLDLLPAELWQNKEARFLDPVTKSGVFLREIAKRLNTGLADQIPDQQTRINHIFSQQLYGIAITELTALLARRSVYCSKTANGRYSICDSFSDPQGNILFKRTQHSWKNGKCHYCGASQTEYERDNSLETHAYQFIHTDKPQVLFGNNMKFDVIIGNPPYQLSDGGAQASATPIYQNFILQAKKLNPRYLSMIVPARWYSGGKGLDEFREEMLRDSRLSEIHDYPDTNDCFRGLNIRGGVCYFLWDREHTGNCKITNYSNGLSVSATRPLLEKNAEVFIRFNNAVSILRKVQAQNEASFSNVVSSRKPFGFATNFTEFNANSSANKNIALYRFGKMGYVATTQVEKNKNWLGKYKVIVPYSSPGDDSYPHLILSKPIISEPSSCCTETYLVVGPFENRQQCLNVSNYMRTKFLRFLVLLLKPTQHVTQKTYGFVPMQDFSELWSDERLYEKYGITTEEQSFIDSLIRPMDLANE